MHQATWGRYSRERERVREERAGSPDHLGTVQQREREGEGGESRLTRPPGDGTAERGGEGGESRLTRPHGDGTAEREGVREGGGRREPAQQTTWGRYSRERG